MFNFTGSEGDFESWREEFWDIMTLAESAAASSSGTACQQGAGDCACKRNACKTDAATSQPEVCDIIFIFTLKDLAFIQYSCKYIGP